MDNAGTILFALVCLAVLLWAMTDTDMGGKNG